MASETGHRPDGFTLVEVVLALFILAVGIIATAPLFVYAARENAVGGDLGEVGDLAVRSMERLRATDYVILTNVGDLNSNVDAYYSVSESGFLVRWVVADNPNPPASTKTITVRAISDRQIIGRQKEVTLIAVRGN